MNEQELRAVVISTLKTIAPEVEEGDLGRERLRRGHAHLDPRPRVEHRLDLARGTICLLRQSCKGRVVRGREALAQCQH